MGPQVVLAHVARRAAPAAVAADLARPLAERRIVPVDASASDEEVRTALAQVRTRFLSRPVTADDPAVERLFSPCGRPRVAPRGQRFLGRGHRGPAAASSTGGVLMRATIVMLMLVACGDDSPVEEAVVPQPVVTGETMQIDEDPCEQPGSWDHTGQPFMLTWCTGCHAGGRVGEERHGAPDGVDFDTLSDVQAWETRILARVEDGTMPPGEGLRTPSGHVSRIGLRADLARRPASRVSATACHRQQRQR